MMMKKLRIFVILFILAFSFSVKAEVLLEIDCNSKEISDNKVTCEGNLIYETEGINDIEFNYQTGLDISFHEVDGFSLKNNNGKVIIHTDEKLYDEIMNSTKIMEFTLSSNNNSKEKEEVKFNNIKINNKSDIIVDDVIESFDVIVKENKKSSICTLDKIMVENKLIDGFDKDKFEYKDIFVTNEIIFIDAVRTDNKSSATNLGNVRVPKGETITTNITVTAEDGTIKVYKLHITNTSLKDEPLLADEVVKSSDNSLKSLELFNKNTKIDFNYVNEKDKYNIEIKEDLLDKLTIKAELNDSKATFVKNFGPRDVKLEYGTNEVLIKVQAENDEVKTIILKINYQDNRSEDNSLMSLKINDVEVNLADELLKVILPFEESKTKIEAVATNEKAKIEYNDIELNVGDNEVNITVTAENGEETSYEVDVVREEEKTYFDEVVVPGYNIGFSKDKTSYTLKLPNEVNEIEINVLPNNIDFEVLNNKNLRNGSKVEIRVTDSDGVHEYQINIEKENILLNIICYVVFGIGVITFISSIIYVIKKKKK